MKLRVLLSCAAAAIVVLSLPAANAQPFPQDYRDGFGGRITPETPQTIDASRGGYFRVVFEPVAINRGATCPPREAIRNTERALFEWVFKKKREWGISAQLSIPARRPGQTATLLDATFVRVSNTGGRNCVVEITEQVDYRSPLIPFESFYYNYDTQINVKLLNWYAEAADKDRINALWRGLSAGVNLIAPGAGLITEAVQERGKAETEAVLNDRIAASFVHPLRAGASITPIRLRIGPAGDQSGEVRITLRTVGSVFASGDQYPDLSSTSVFDILRTRINAPAQPIESVVEASVIENLKKQETPELFAAACEPMFTELARIGLSDVDQTVYVWALASNQPKIGAANLHRLPCLATRASLLDKVRIKIKAAPPAARSVTNLEIRDLLLRAAERESAAFGPRVQLSGDLTLLGLGTVDNTVVESSALLARLGERVENNGCFEPNTGQRADIRFGVPMGMPTGNAGETMRIGAAAIRLRPAAAGGERAVVAFIYRFDGVPENGAARIDGIHITTRPGSDIGRAFARCRTTLEWIAPLLQP